SFSPPDRLAQGGAMTRRSSAVLLAATLLFTSVLVGRNLHLFSRPVHEHADFAANSLLILRARRLTLLHGHYSRLRFYHPAPGILSFLAGSEWLLSDTLRVVPAPHNAHMLGQLLLDALLLGIAVTVIARAGGGWRAGIAATLVFLVFFGRHGHLASHWLAY